MMNTEGLCLGCMSDNGGERICPICGFDNSTPNPSDCLPTKSVIKNRYTLGAVIDRDGEGITYIGWDNARTAKIKVKEYFPNRFARRNPDKTVSMTEEGRYTFNECLLEFIEINKAVMNASLPALVNVFDVFEENGTAFAVMEYISGITLESFLEKNGGSLKWEQARPLFLPVIDTIGGMNDLGYIHGGISTETIIVGRDGKLRVSEYSVKKLRRAGSELEYKIYGGYAACEQYGLRDMYVGTYTDVYGLCATLFRVFMGNPPPEAAQRMHSDVMNIPARFAEELPRQVLAALANGLQVLPQNRTKNIEIFKNELVYGEIYEPPVQKSNDISSSSKAKTAEKKKKQKKGSSAKYALISAICTVVVLGVILGIVLPPILNGDSSGKESSINAPSFVQPETESLGDVQSGAELIAKLYPVPDLSGKYYSEITKEKDYEMFEFVIKNKAFSDEYPKGTVCKQTVKAGKEVARDTKIEVTISLGPKEINIANLKGMTEAEAKLELLKQGFLYDNIHVLEKYDEDSDPGVVIEQIPAYGDGKVSTDIAVEIYINSYEGDTSSENEFGHFTDDEF